MPYEGPPLHRLRVLLRSGAQHTVKRRDQKEPHVQHIFSDAQVWEMARLLDQLEERNIGRSYS